MTDKLREMLEALPTYRETLGGMEEGPALYDGQDVFLRREDVLAALAAAPQPAPEDREAREVLSALSSYLGAGMGDENTTPEEFDKRIRWGIDNHVSAVIALAADTVERLSKKPGTTWGEVKSAIAALAAAPQPAPDREDLVRLLQIITRNGSLDDGRTLHEVIADALLARGLCLPGNETMAWGIIRKDGEIIAGGLRNKEAARNFAHEGERVVRVALRVVEGGDDAA